jgi:predicted dehydrogenase
MNRRDFFKNAGAVAAALQLNAQTRPPASDRVTVGIIGTGNQGTNDMMGVLRDERVQVVAVCDLNRGSAGYWDGIYAGREPAKAVVEWIYAQDARSGKYKGCTGYEDYRQLLARKDIDAVLIAVPDHWHGLTVIDAAKAGKDIYGEKPLSLTISQGRAMSDAVKQYKRVFQTGSQQRSDWRFRLACEAVRNGRLGKLQTVRCGLPGGTPDLAKVGSRRDPEPVPDGFNYEMWLGPAPKAPYMPARCFVNYRWIFDYSGGELTDWGGHHPDIAQWGMDTEHTGPVAIKNARGEFAKDPLWNTATHFYFECLYDNGVKLIVSDKERGGVTFEGTEGWVWVNRGAIDAKPRSLIDALQPGEKPLYVSNDHFRNWIDCIHSRQETIAPIENAHRSITIAHLGNISLRLGRDLKWDPAEERFIDDDSANAMLARPMREPWKI